MTDKKAEVYMGEVRAGILTEEKETGLYSFSYLPDYTGPPISLTMPVRREPYVFIEFPPFFDGLLPEGIQLESLLRRRKIDRKDYFSQLLAVGSDMVGAVTVYPLEDGV
ncbi:MAG: HipA N-terminal domain-containing protein [Spirochaetia bacterium]